MTLLQLTGIRDKYSTVGPSISREGLGTCLFFISCHIIFDSSYWRWYQIKLTSQQLQGKSFQLGLSPAIIHSSVNSLTTTKLSFFSLPPQPYQAFSFFPPNLSPGHTCLKYMTFVCGSTASRKYLVFVLGLVNWFILYSMAHLVTPSSYII